MGAKIEIHTLGEFKILVNGENILDKLGASKKKISLLEYLILNRKRPASVKDLFETLWPDDNNTNPENALKTLVSRLRKNLEDFGLRSAIVTKNGAYMWNPDLECWVDIYELETLCDELQKLRAINDDTQQRFERLLLLYSSDLLGNTAMDSWAVTKSMHYHNLYLKAIYHYIALLNDKKRYNDVVRVCRIALEIDTLDSMLNLELMSALLKLGRHKEAMAQYEYATDMQYTHLGTKPSAEILNFYKNLIRDERTSEADIKEILDELRVDTEPQQDGAFVCEYAIFKDIYHLHMRNLKRLGTSMFIVLVTLNQIDSQPMDAFLLDKYMKELLSTLQLCLRKGDTISRHSPTQYALLLPSINFDTGRQVMERVKKTFYKKCPSTKFMMNYRMSPIEADDA